MKYCLIILLFVVALASCKKDSFITSPDASLSTSRDSLFFDTVFTSIGSVTQSFKIYNNNNQKLNISQVKLAGGSASPFKINIDGTPGPQLNNIEVNANDSLYIFVQVNVDPTSGTLPFILSDSIQIDYNGNKRFVQLQAYGQNAHFLRNETIRQFTVWNGSDLPFVILGGLRVDTGVILHLTAGVKVYFHADAPLIVDGSFEVNATAINPTILSGDRTDADYKDLPASWPGIIFRNSSKKNWLIHATIKNAYQGIVSQGLSAVNPKVSLSQCVISNAYDAGILGVSTSIYADNCLVSNCGSNINLVYGGDYRFVNCTVASYGNFYVPHKTPVLQVADYISQNNIIYTAPLNASFINSIFWGDFGSVDNEVLVEKKGPGPFSVLFDHVLYKSKTDPSFSTLNAVLKNIPPLFDSINTTKSIYDFHFTKSPNAPAINAGIPTIFGRDLEDKVRDAQPDLGCYEK